MYIQIWDNISCRGHVDIRTFSFCALTVAGKKKVKNIVEQKKNFLIKLL